jgi:hypothetical protein
MDELRLLHEKDKEMTTKLSLATLGMLDDKVAKPKYARTSLSPGILHFGVGNFHRAHMAVYLDDLFNLGVSKACSTGLSHNCRGTG